MVRKNEHQQYTRLKNLSLATAEHHMRTEYRIIFEETKIVVRIPYYHQRKLREPIKIIIKQTDTAVTPC